MTTIIEIWMIIIGLSMAIAEIPQIVRVIKRKSSDDISLWMVSLILFGVMNWFAYGIYLSSISLIVTNALCSIMMFIMLVLTIKYRKKENEKEKMSNM